MTNHQRLVILKLWLTITRLSVKISTWKFICMLVINRYTNAVKLRCIEERLFEKIGHDRFLLFWWFFCCFLPLISLSLIQFSIRIQFWKDKTLNYNIVFMCCSRHWPLSSQKMTFYEKCSTCFEFCAQKVVISLIFGYFFDISF